MEAISFAHSPCPNDTFAFHAITHGLVETGGLRFKPVIDDVETLNHAAFTSTHALTRLSYHAYLLLGGRYHLLDSGSVLGFGCGPLVVSGRALTVTESTRIAVPGMYTTALLLLRLWMPGVRDITPMRFDQILERTASGEFDAGLIIHEGRLMYGSYGLRQVVDLGEWWECETGLPIPLGCIALRNEPGLLPLEWRINDAVRASVEYALANPVASHAYVRGHAREMDEDIMRRHISLYVNRYSVELGDDGRRAIAMLEEMARCRGALTPV